MEEEKDYSVTFGKYSREKVLRSHGREGGKVSLARGEKKKESHSR